MTTASILAIGGPAHGTYFERSRSQYRWVSLTEMEEVYVLRGSSVAKPVGVEVLYSKYTFYISRENPRRYKALDVALVEGGKLETYQLLIEREMLALPWVVPTANILKDFDQWFAATFYQKTGAMWERKRGPFDDDEHERKLRSMWGHGAHCAGPRAGADHQLPMRPSSSVPPCGGLAGPGHLRSGP